jgi:hypothetical protein
MPQVIEAGCCFPDPFDQHSKKGTFKLFRIVCILSSFELTVQASFELPVQASFELTVQASIKTNFRETRRIMAMLCSVTCSEPISTPLPAVRKIESRKIAAQAPGRMSNSACLWSPVKERTFAN